MKRQRALLEYALGALARRPGRSVALAVGLALVTGLYASALFLTDSLRAEVESAAAGVPDLTVQAMAGGRPALLDAASLEALDAALVSEPGVRSIRPRVWGYLFWPAIEANVVLVGAGEGEADAARVGFALAQRLGLREGDRLALPLPPEGSLVLRATTITGEETALHDADVLEVSEATARQLLGIPEGSAVDVAVTLATPDESPVVAERVAGAIPFARVLDRPGIQRAYELTFDGRSGLLGILLLPCLAALLLLAWERLTGLGPEEQREIGILKAIGWETRDVLVARLYESTVISVAGALIGLVVAYAFVFWLGAPGMAGAMLGWSTLHADLDLVPAIDLTQILFLFGVVVVPFAGVGLVPAWRAAMLDADRATRQT